MVDDDLYDWVIQWSWCASRKNGKWVVIRTISSNTTKSGHTTLKLHRVIWEHINGPIPHSGQIDHINGDGLDNRIENLRLANNQQNQRNRGPNRNNNSGWKGVSWQKRDQRWRVQIMVDGSMRNLGTQNRKIIGALVYDRAAIEAFGDFARLNFPNISTMLAEGRLRVNLK